MSMVWIVFTVPFLWATMLGLLSWLETSTLAPGEMATKIQSLLESGDPDQIEIQVAELLAPSMKGGSPRSR